MKSPLTLEDAQKIGQRFGLSLLSAEYINNRTQLRWRCGRKHEWNARLDNVCSGYGCPQCARDRSRLTIEDVQKLAASRGYVLLSSSYRNAHSPLLWKCAKGHSWKTSLGVIKHQGSGCPECAGAKKLTLEHAQKVGRERGYTLLSLKYRNTAAPLHWHCSKGHEWKSPLQRIKSGHGCPECALAEIRAARAKLRLGIEVVHEAAKQAGFTLLSDNYVNANTKLRWACQQGHEWWAPWATIRQGSGCPECNFLGVKERVCREEFEAIFGRAFPKSRPHWLKGRRGRRLELDGYCPELRLAFEFQGRQHDIYSEFFHQGDPFVFVEQQERDEDKKRACQENGVYLYVIPYEENENTLRETIRSMIVPSQVTEARKPSEMPF